MEYTINEIVTDFADIDIVFAKISKEDVIALYKEQGQTLEESTDLGTLTEGEVQISFDKNNDQLNPTEILVFGVYEDVYGVESYHNGDDFIRLDRLSPDMIKDAFARLQQVREQDGLEL